MKPTFREDKTTQAAAIFLGLRRDKMSHLKLIKLLYLADRRALLTLGRPISYDSYVSMDQGPVLSTTLNLIHGDVPSSGPWEKAISVPYKHEVSLSEDPGDDKLSEAEVEIIRDIFNEHGKKCRWDLCDFTHTLPEWEDPKGSSIKIEYQDILSASNKTDAEIESILEDIEGLALMEEYLGN
jgi:uncharacterized phage-associated protein